MERLLMAAGATLLTVIGFTLLGGLMTLIVWLTEALVDAGVPVPVAVFGPMAICVGIITGVVTFSAAKDD